MRFFDAISLAFGNLTRTRFRTILTISGVVIGISSIVLLVSLGIGLERIVTNQIADIDTLLTLSVTQKPETASMEKGAPINNSAIEKIQALKGVKYVSPMLNIAGSATVGDTTSTIFVIALKKDYLKLEINDFVAGKELDDENEVVISQSLAQSFGKEPQDLIGKEILLKTTNTTQENNPEVGELKAKISGVDSAQNGNYVYISLVDFNKTGTYNTYSSLKVRVDSQKMIEPVTQSIKSLGYEVNTVKELIDQISKIFVLIEIFLALFGMIGLVVATLGIINTMAISLAERIKEIGIMKAIGASNKDVKKIFLYESALIGFLGGIIGNIIAFTIGYLINSIVILILEHNGQAPMPLFVFSCYFSFIMVVFSIIASLFAGIYPAIRAQKLQPLEALFQR